MKKFLLLSAVMCAALSVNAQALQNFSASKAGFGQNPAYVAPAKKAPALKADLKDGEFLVGYFTDDYYSDNGLGFNGDLTLEIGTELFDDLYDGLNGFKVNGVRFALCNTAEVKSVKLYGVTPDNYITDALAVKEVNQSCSAGWNYFAFDQPVLIDDDLIALIPVYEFVNKQGAYAMAMNDKTNDGSFLAYGPLSQDGSMMWGDMGLDYGTPAIQMVCTADPLEGYNLKVSGYESSTVAMGQEFKPTFIINSSSEKAVENMHYTISFGGVETSGTYNFSKAIPAGVGQKANFTTTLTAPQEAGSLPVVFTIDAVNGEALETPAVSTVRQDVVTRIASRMSVVEEFTGTGCGWCPRGWVGMEKVKHELSDQAVVIALHQFNTTDPMYVATYHSPAFGGAPGAMVDRKSEVEPYYGINDEGIIKSVKRFAQILPEVAIEVQATYTDANRTKVDASAVTEFLTDAEGSELVFVLTADGLTGTTSAWKQGNYYAQYTAAQVGVSKASDPELYEFCKGGSMGQGSVTLVFNDVMIASSWPSATKANAVEPFTTTAAGEKASSAYTLTLPTKTALKNALVKDEIYLTAMVIKADGTIANAARCRVENPAGIHSVLAPVDEDTTYDLSGRVATPSTKGIMIQGGKKVIR